MSRPSRPTSTARSSDAPDTSDIDELRAFSRFFTRLVGALDYEGHLDSRHPLAQARVLYELRRRGTVEASALRKELGLDPGYFSRMVATAEQDGLIRRGQDPADGRRRQLSLTEPGKHAAALLDARASTAVGRLLDRVPAGQRPRLRAALRTVRRLLAQDGDREGGPDGERERGEVQLRPPAAGDLGWVIQRNAALYSAEYGWNEEYEALVARIVADFAAHRDPRYEACWIAELEGEPVGAVFCMRARDHDHDGEGEGEGQPGTAKLRLLLVEPTARGHGVGARLVDQCVDFARRTGYRELVLWTNDVLTAARRIYQRAGFTLVDSAPHRSFGHDLVGQTWRLDLHC
jgi:DNA-binding MarR family transcriptional regulator/GNAT superfamily N-acetyltransferase